jgi:hypothetical protein
MSANSQPNWRTLNANDTNDEFDYWASLAADEKANERRQKNAEAQRKKRATKRAEKATQDVSHEDLTREDPMELGENTYLEKCTTLETTAYVFKEFVESPVVYNSKNSKKVNTFRTQLINKILEFVNREMSPSFDDINSMLLICRCILAHETMNCEFEKFIFNCPNKFIITYSNNSETTPDVLDLLEELGFKKSREYLIQHVHYTKLNTWSEREILL